MGKLVLFLILFSFNTLAIDPDNLFQNDIQILESIIHNLEKKVGHKDPKRGFSFYFADPEKRILDTFDIDPLLKTRVNFWFNIYTEYDSNQVVLHDKKDLAIVYDVIDFTDLAKSILNRHTKFSIQNKIIRERVKEYRKVFSQLSKGAVRSPRAERIFTALRKAGYKIPSSKSKNRKSFFQKFSKSFRAQTGQKDNIAQGLENLATYRPVIESYFKEFNVPIELLAIPFLESSFNIHARSKVGATGPWQFMMRTGKHFMSIDKYRDQRRNPLIATVGALHLLKQNLKILKRWDLAVTAYNGGTGLMLKGIRRLKKKHKYKNPSLIHLLKHYKDGNFGFANQNFYSSFLALVYTLAYRDNFFLKPNNQSVPSLNIYVTKCKLKPSWFLSILEKQSPMIKKYNNHFNRRRLKSNFPKGTLIISDIELTPKRYKKVPIPYMRKRYPINWIRLVKNQSCSTK